MAKKKRHVITGCRTCPFDGISSHENPACTVNGREYDGEIRVKEDDEEPFYSSREPTFIPSWCPYGDTILTLAFGKPKKEGYYKIEPLYESEEE